MRWILLATAGCAGAADPRDLRRAWLVDVLYEDNLVWTSRDPALLEDKYAVMAADPYDYVRGSSGVFLRDLAGGGRTTFLTVPEALQIAILGDPHPENLAVFAPGWGPFPTGVDPPLVLEAADLDGAGFGPYLVDVRRALLGTAVLLHAGGCGGDCLRAVLGAEARAYAEEVEGQAEGDPPWGAALVRGRAGVVLDRTIGDVVTEGHARVALLSATEPTEGEARLVKDGDLAGGLVPLDDEERAQLERLLATLVVPPDFRVLDVARRYGVGVASRPAIRYAVLWDTGRPGDEDDALVQLREVVDAPAIPGVRAPGTWDDAEDRVVGATLAAWSRPDVDPWLQAVSDGAQTFKVLTWSSYVEPLDHGRIARDLGRGRATQEDLEVLADTLGRQLASVHARAPTPGGGPALPAIAADLGRRLDRFVDEQVEAAEHDLGVALTDHGLFVDALARGELAP